MNRRPVIDSDDEEGDSDMDGEKDSNADDEDQDGGVGINRDLLEDLDESDDEEEMAELRRRVLQSRPFMNPTGGDQKPSAATSFINRTERDQKPPPDKIPKPEALPVDSDAESGSDLGGDDDLAFDNIINATPVTDQTGIQAKQRLRGGPGDDHATAVFSRTVVGAPKKF